MVDNGSGEEKVLKRDSHLSLLQREFASLSKDFSTIVIGKRIHMVTGASKPSYEIVRIERKFSLISFPDISNYEIY
jgi:hypothetical protein